MSCLWADIPLRSRELGGAGHVVIVQTTPNVCAELHYQDGELVRLTGFDKGTWSMMFDLKFTKAEDKA